jgi:hypothetical protein
LQPDDELHTTPSVQLATSDAEKHGEVSVRACSLTFVDHDVLDILIFRFRSDGIGSLATAQTAKDVSRFFVSSNLRQPARAFWEEPADSE